MTALTEEQYQAKIRELEKEVKKLNLIIQKDSKTKYGLRWIDVPEAFEKESENKIPILEEVKDKAIKNDDGKPTHILIEGDNYHALKCLNYTHKGKIDVIYIDPPYNTGSDGFTYKDKRFLNQYPDGTTIPKEHPLRHSTWLSFMSKRLELAKNLLSEKGVIFISIDDNEQANLKLLCDEIFGEIQYIATFQRLTTKSGKTPLTFMTSHDSIICYARKDLDIFVGTSFEDESYKFEDEYLESRGKYNLKQPLDCNSISYSKSLDYEIEYDGIKYYPGTDYKKFLERKNGKYLQKDYAWRWSKDLFEFGLKNGWIVFKNGRIYTKGYLNATIENIDGQYKVIYREKTRKRSTIDFINNDYSNDIAKKQLQVLNINLKFDYPKPINLISDLIETHFSKNATILDFFAGSGTTLHATMKLNSEDGGKRQCILVQQNEKDNNICQNITYERNRRVMQGYINPKGEAVSGLGNSLKYYRTAFVGENEAEYATDKDKIALSKKAGCLLSMAENTLEEYVSTDRYQIFGDDKNLFTGIYFSANADKVHEFAAKLEQLRNMKERNSISAYFFSSGDGSEFADEFESLRNIKIKSIPEPILEIYRRLN